MKRRDFLKSQAALALGGGLATLGSANKAGATESTATGPVGPVGASGAAEPAAPSAQANWSHPWRPESPRRLCDQTRQLAARVLAGEHGQAMKNAEFALEESLVAGLSNNMRYAQACLLVAQKAPLRVLPGERLAGAATLHEASAHLTPLMGQTISTSHTTIGFPKALRVGYKGLRALIDERLARGGLDEKGVDLLKSMRLCLDAAGVWHQRYMDELERLEQTSTGAERENYQQVRAALANVPENPPRAFREAVQALWCMWDFNRLMGNWPGIGRIDVMLGSYLEKDLAEGRITLDEARELIAHFWIKGCEWIGANRVPGSGDAQHYQNIVLAGIGPDGRDMTNDFTYLILDVVEELHISDFPIAVRINKNTPDRLLRRIAEVQRHGGGTVALYNEEVVIEGLVKFGYPLEEARDFANDGCWEVLIPGKTCFGYNPFDALGMLHEVLCLQDASKPVPEYAGFAALYEAYLKRLRAHIDGHRAMLANHCKAPDHPVPLLSIFVEDCIERGRSYFDRGPKYTALAPHAGGLANVANSLLVIRKLVFEEQYLSLPEFIEVLRNDWQGQEPLRQLVLNRFSFYGNDDAEADGMLERVFNDYTAIVAEEHETHGVKVPAGISTFGREIEWSHPEGPRRASPDGYRRGAVLATNFSPSPGTDKRGPTAALKSYCKMDLTRTPNGATLELKVHPSSVKGEEGLTVLVALMRSFVQLGGFYLHIDVVDSAMLLDAQRHPEKYPNLPVRISGWSARFATLNKEWQDMVIARTQQVV